MFMKVVDIAQAIFCLRIFDKFCCQEVTFTFKIAENAPNSISNDSKRRTETIGILQQ